MGNEIIVPPLCDCGEVSELVTGKEIYPHRADLHSKAFYRCPGECDAYVGCHPGTRRPLGRLADPELRHWKSQAHRAFDPIWKRRFEERSALDPDYKKGMARGGRYKKLAELLGIPKEECHIGMFTVELCKQTVALCHSGVLEEDL